MTVSRIDHFVLTVSDIEQTCAFYSQIDGVEVLTFGPDRTALKVGTQKINLHEADAEIEPRASNPTVGGGDFCLITSKPVSILKTELASAGVTIERGPVPRTGTRNKLRSIYLRDPDGNLVELANEV
ncbi:VOC family protein [Natronocalculus amylovorans]|uniref:VOC family protein n=1 Tax=Natronocalculus amylovorans TaxID=2917812 RepID=A0AAE3FUL7_9EURY|nr:VOC family protein [Natronocalculus amylovorans]MCL9815506.1 VOC family protein [Natronocalculus amylovorans]NUE01980.1 VOC family protein [Halorubraceae archaeon YAN]